MTVERISMFVLTLVALLMGANYVSATSRFLDANRAFQELTLELASFNYENPQLPVYYSVTVTNPAKTDVEVLAVRTTLRAGVQLVGGGELYATEVLQPDESFTYDITAHISDVSLVERAELEGPIVWLIRGEILVRLDQEISPVWVRFAKEIELS